MQSDDVSLKGIAGFFAILAVTLTIVYGVLTLVWRGFEKNAQAADAKVVVRTPQPYFPEPREQPHPGTDFVVLRAHEEAELNSYGWIDKTNGIVRIPIDRAIELLTPSTKGQP